MRLSRRVAAAERMDDPGLDPTVYAEVIGDLAKVNRLLMVYRPTLRFLDRALAGRKRLKLLDVGFGQGDMLRAVARWARRRGVEAELVGIDLNPSSRAAALAATPPRLGIELRTGDYAELAGQGWDAIVSASVTHHMDDGEIHAFLRFMEKEARLGWMINDIRRSRLAYLAFPWLARAAGWHDMVRHDGRLSIARSFRAADWRTLIAGAGIDPGPPRIVRRFPFRLCVERTR